jgi:hypothetical protein
MITQKTNAPQKFLPFSDYVKMLPTQWVFEHFLKKSISTRQILSSSAINDRIRQFSQPNTIAALYESLEPELQVICALTYLMGGMGLTASGSGDLNDVLIQSFLVYASRNKRGEVRYFGFSEFETILGPLFAAKLAGTAAAKGKVSPVPERHGNCTNDITMTVTLASQGFLEKKKQGGLTRNSLLKMGKLTHEASLLQEQESLAGMLVKYCVHAGIVQENENGYYHVADRFEEWLLRPARERSVDILGFAVGFSGSWRTGILRETAVAADGGWLSCTVFPEETRKVAIDTLRILCWAGVVALSRAGTDTVFGAPREKEPVTENRVLKMADKIVLMPDFAAVLPAESAPEFLYRFGKIGMLQSLDRVYKGTISREILNDSLSGGLEGPEVLAWLAEWAAPANVIATVREWVREFYRLYLSSGSMLITTDEKVSFQIASFVPLKQYLEPMPSHSVFRIRHGTEDKVREFLGQMGFDHRMPDRDRHDRDRPGMQKTVANAAETAQVSAPVPPPAGDQSSETWEPVVDIAAKTEIKPLVLRGKKYGAGLKTLDLNEIMHIIDYAILTGTELVLDYAGSPFIKKGEYTVVPRTCNKGTDPQLDATLKNGLKKQFHVRKISKIGVGIS